jgi:hypothetical protein
MARKHKLAQLLVEEWNRFVVAPAARPGIKQLSILEELGWQPPKSCSGATPAPEQKSPAPEQTHWVETYSPSKRKAYSYYRYVWMEGRKLRHRHLPGGNVDSPRAMQLKERVELAIAARMSPAMIEQLIEQG